MKTARELIERIRVWEANVRQIADSRIINGSLLIDIETAMKDYATEAIQADRERIKQHHADELPSELFNDLAFELGKDIDNLPIELK